MRYQIAVIHERSSTHILASDYVIDGIWLKYKKTGNDKKTYFLNIAHIKSIEVDEYDA